MGMAMAHLDLRVIRRDSMTDETKRHRQGFVHVHAGLWNLAHDAVGRIEPSRARSDDGHAKRIRV
jgi:hypothetical protein